MFWLFFFMYAAPILFQQYSITNNCTFLKAGPDENNPGARSACALIGLFDCLYAAAAPVPVAATHTY
jgi:hypothetical protein